MSSVELPLMITSPGVCGPQRDRIGGGAKSVEFDLLVGPCAVGHDERVARHGTLHSGSDVRGIENQKLSGSGLAGATQDKSRQRQ